MKVAIVGSGISGLSAASALAKGGHSVTIFEKSGHVGGHARTTVVDGTPVDVGFQLLNRTTYPNLVHFFEENGIEMEPSPLTFSFDFDDTHVPAPTPADLALFEEDVLSFLRGAPQPEVTLGQFLEGRTYTQEFRSAYLVPLCAGIWLSSKEAILGASARTVLSFLRDLKMLQVSGHLPWMTVKGRSQAYVNKLVSVLESSGVEIRTSAPVSAVERTASGVAITANGSSTVFDKVIIAAHAPDALALLGDGATSAEKAILGAFSYVKSTVVLHRDASLMPADPAAWGAWNFVGSTTGASSITYWLNKLQNLDGVAPLFLTINPHTPPTHVLDNDPYPPMHWEPNSSSARAMADFASIQGQHNTWFAGAYQGYGFHEDGFKAGMAAAYDIMGQVYQPITAPAVDAPAVAYKACKPLAVFEGIAKMEATKA